MNEEKKQGGTFHVWWNDAAVLHEPNWEYYGLVNVPPGSDPAEFIPDHLDLKMGFLRIQEA